MAETEGDEEWAEGDMLDAAETLAAETFIRNLVEGGEDKEGTPNSADDGQDKLDVDPLADEEAIHPAEIHILDDSNESTSSSDAEEDSIDEVNFNLMEDMPFIL